MTIAKEAVHAAARILAELNGDAWVFEQPKMDGVARSGTSPSVYLRQAEEVLEAAAPHLAA